VEFDGKIEANCREFAWRYNERLFFLH
jgi:hypothetical protein